MIDYLPHEDASPRTPVVHCAMCGARFDALVQSKASDGMWSPAIERVLEQNGWHRAGAAWFCCRLCADKHAYGARRGFGGVRDTGPVTALADASYQRARSEALQAPKRPR